MDEVFTLNDQDTSDHSEFGIADEKHSMVTDYPNNDPLSEKVQLLEEENERLRNNMKKLKKRMIQTSQMVQLYTNAQDHLQQSVQREFEAQKQIEALRHQVEELIILSQPQVDRVSSLESENERLNALVLEKDIQIKSKESLINQLKADALQAEEMAQMVKHLETTTKETEVLKKEIKLKTVQHRKWAAKTELLDAQIKEEQAKIAELEKILASRKEPNEIEREILRMQYCIEERDRTICEKEREVSVKDEEITQLQAELEQTKILLHRAQEEAKQNQENYEMKIIRLEQRLKVKRHENSVRQTTTITNNHEEDVLQMPIHKPIEAPTDLANHSMDISNHNNSMIDEIFGSDVIMEDETSDNTERNENSVAELTPDSNSAQMDDVTEVVEQGSRVAPKKTPSALAKRSDETESEHVLRVVSTFLGYTPLNHTYLQASRHLKNYTTEDIAKTFFHAMERHIEVSDDIINYKRTLFLASHLSKAKPGFMEILTELIHSEVLANFKLQFSELFFNIATLTHQYHFIYEIAFNWLAQQSSLEQPTMLRLAVKFLPLPKKLQVEEKAKNNQNVDETDDPTESLFWTLCIIVYRNELEDLKDEISKKGNNPHEDIDVDKEEDNTIFKILESMVEPSSTQFYAMVLECIIKFGGQQILSKILANACKLTETNTDHDVQKAFHSVLKTILTKNTFLFSYHRKLPFWLQLIVAQVLVENIIDADDNYEIFVQRLSLWRDFLNEEQKNSIPEELTNYLNVVENFVQKKY